MSDHRSPSGDGRDPQPNAAPGHEPNARPGTQLSDVAVHAAIDHVRLSYIYLDAGDADGYASLFEHGSELEEPPTFVVTRGRHLVEELMADGDRIVAVGHVDAGAQRSPVEFADVFIASATGLLRSKAPYRPVG